jgi:hypothetical protein
MNWYCWLKSYPLLNSVGSNSKAAHAPEQAFGQCVGTGLAARSVVDLGWPCLAELSQLVRVSRIDQPEAVLLRLSKALLPRENLKLRLLNARSVCWRDKPMRRAVICNWQSATFSASSTCRSRKGQTTLSLLKQTQNQMHQADMPRLDAIAAALATAAAGR